MPRPAPFMYAGMFERADELDRGVACRGDVHTWLPSRIAGFSARDEQVGERLDGLAGSPACRVEAR